MARSGSHGVSSRYGVPPTRIHGRYVIPFLARSSSLALDAHPSYARGPLPLHTSLVPVQSFLTLPDASKVSFVDVDATDLVARLPNLPPSTTTTTFHTDTTAHAPSPDPVPSPLDLVHRFLVYEPSRRLHPSEALGHPWFKAEPGLVLPTDDDRTGCPPWVTETGAVTHSFTLDGQTRTLGDLLQMHVASKER